MHLAPGVHDLALTYERGDGEFEIHPAAVETPHGLILVDVGLDVAVLREGLDEHGLNLEDVTTVLLTHQDGDHVAALPALLEETDASVFAHREATPYIDGRTELVKGDRRYDPVPVDVEVREGVRIRTAAGPMEVVFTPGHAPGHVSLFFPDHGALLAGDAVTAADGELAGPSEEFTPNRDRALESVGHLASYDIERVLCYHGGPATVDQATLETVAESG